MNYEICKCCGKPKKPNTPAGRWPANLLHDGSDEVVGLFPMTKSGKMGPQHTRTTNGSPNGIYGKFDVNHPLSETYGDSGSAARFFYCSKASKRDRDEGLDYFRLQPGGKLVGNNIETQAPGNKIGQHPNKICAPVRNIHPTCKPTTLMRYLCRLITPPGGIVLDPFMGSGSTGKAAVLEGFRFIGIDQESDYFQISIARIKFALKQPKKLL